MSVAAPLAVREGDRPRLEALTRSTSVRAGLAQRARIVLLAADGLTNAEIARRTGSTRPTVLAWRQRYEAGGIDALRDKPRSGRPAKVDEIAVVATTLADQGKPPEHLRVQHWSARLLGREMGISYTTVARIWRKWGIDPTQVSSFKFAAGGAEVDPALLTHSHALVQHSAKSRAKSRRGMRSKVGAAPRRDASAGDRRLGEPAVQRDPWLDLVEVSLNILTYQAIRRGTFASVRNLIEAIGALTDGWNDREEPRIARRTCRTTTGRSVDRKTTSGTRQPCTRSSRSSDVDLRGGADRAPNRLRAPLSLRAEFHGTLHGTRCGGGGRTDPTEG